VEVLGGVEVGRVVVRRVEEVVGGDVEVGGDGSSVVDGEVMKVELVTAGRDEFV
jgi:hypothetical protein